MRLGTAISATLAAAWVLTTAALAAPTGHLQYVGAVTGEPERDSYGYVAQAIPAETVCVIGPARYFGTVTGDPEKDTYGYPTVLVKGKGCTTAVASSK